VQRWCAGLLLCLALATGAAQEDEAGKANRLIHEGKKLDALPLYEDLAKAHPEEWLYAERLADCLGAKALQTDDPAEAKALRTRQRDEAKRAVALGDPNAFVQMMANADPDQPIEWKGAGAAGELLKQAEKAFTAGDFDGAMAKYVEAAAADPKLYEAPLYAGDTALRQKDLNTAAKWFAQATAIDPDRETAYRYWGDAIVQLGSDPAVAKGKFIDAVVAEPYNKLAWQGLQQWAQSHQAMLVPPKIERPAGPVTDPNKPNNITINIDPSAGKEKNDPKTAVWLGYSMARAAYQMETFKKDFPDAKEYRHTLKEEDSSLTTTIAIAREMKIKPGKLDESLRTLIDLNDAGMLDCWILINAADQGIAQDYDAYRKEHRQQLHDYIAKYIVHGGPM